MSHIEPSFDWLRPTLYAPQHLLSKSFWEPAEKAFDMLTSRLEVNVSLEGLSFDISILSAFKQTQEEKALHKEKQK